MNRKQTDNTYEIRQATSMPTVASSGPLNPFSPGRPESREEKWIQSEWRKRNQRRDPSYSPSPLCFEEEHKAKLSL